MKKNLHLLSRAAFSPTPAALEDITIMGRENWLEEQLHPKRFSNAKLKQLLSSLPTIKMSATELMEQYPRPEPGAAPERGHEFWRPLAELSAAKLLMACYSEAQLNEVMTEFWFNHFNVFGPEALSFYTVPPYYMQVIRKNALGRFPDLLSAVAQTPAMMYYLDNYRSTRDIYLESGEALGLNENYARELLELHTISPKSGYTQKDIIEAAKVLTGWSISRRRDNRIEFEYYPALHVTGKKKVFGKIIKNNGFKEGKSLLRYLSLRPETAENIAHKLVTYLVADDPPLDMVANAKQVFLDSSGDIPAVLREILLSAEFYRQRYQMAKVKSPLRIQTSALRVTSAEVLESLYLVRPFNLLGQPLFQCRPPTGYSFSAGDVLNAGIFLAEGANLRLLAFNKMRGVFQDTRNLVNNKLTGAKMAEALLERILFRFEKSTSATVKKAARDYGFGRNEVLSLIFATPDFMQY